MSRSFLLAFSTAALVLASAGAAHADDSSPIASTRLPAPPEDGPAPGRVTQWYGWETMMTDALSVGVLTAGAVSDNRGAQWPLGIAGLSGFAFGAPVVHAARGRWGLALADLGLRVGALTLGGVIGGNVAHASLGPPPCVRFEGGGCSPPWFYGMDQDISGVLVGAALGGLVASALDASVLSRETVRPKDERPAAFTWSPSFVAMKDGAAGGITGSF